MRAGVVYFAHLLSICHEAYEFSLAQFGINIKDFLKDSLSCSTDYSSGNPVFSASFLWRSNTD
jgi:hypothetical protein